MKLLIKIIPNLIIVGIGYYYSNLLIIGAGTLMILIHIIIACIDIYKLKAKERKQRMDWLNRNSVKK